jgi:heme o synthase
LFKHSIKYNWGILSKLVKHKLSLLVTFSAMAGYLIYPEKDLIEIILLFVGIYLMSGGASALNQYQERKLDACMERTMERPIPSGKLSARSAILISVIYISLGTLALLLNGYIPALLGLANVVFYNLIYTPLKTKSSLSILPGALVGAIPPLIGWTSAGGSMFHPTIIYIAVFMFIWQLPHFWLLLIMFGKQYEMAGFSSISKFYNTNQIKHIVFFWAIVTSLFLFFFPVFNIHLPTVLAVVLILSNLFFIFMFYRLIYGKEEKKAIRKAFILINTYLMVALIIFIINSFV